MSPARYAKSIVATLSAGLLAIQSVIPMSDASRAWVTVSIAVLAAVTVYLVPNAPTPDAAAQKDPAAATGSARPGLAGSGPDADRDAG